MYVCLCKGITDRQIRQAVAGGAHSLDDVRLELDVSSQCGQCSDMVKDIVSDSLMELLPHLYYEVA